MYIYAQGHIARSIITALFIARACCLDVEHDQLTPEEEAYARSVAAALPRYGFDPANRGRLAVVYYGQRGWNLSASLHVGAGPGGGPYDQSRALKHTRLLNCSIQAFRHKAAQTPADFIVAVPLATLARDGPPPFWLRAPDVKVVLIEDMPRSPDGGWPNPYIQMGSWRLFQQMPMLRALGYRYVLQSDDDGIMHGDPGGSMVDLMEGRLMGGYNRVHGQEWYGIRGGGAELMAFFIHAYRYKPQGEVYAHCSPPGLRGLYSHGNCGHGVATSELTFNRSVSPNTDGFWEATVSGLAGGWDGSQLSGHWNTFDLDFWFRPDVARFISLCSASKMVWRRRWNELMCQSMVAELFVPASAYRVFENPKNIAGHYSFLAPLPEFCDAYLGISRNAAVNNTFDVHV